MPGRLPRPSPDPPRPATQLGPRRRAKIVSSASEVTMMARFEVQVPVQMLPGAEVAPGYFLVSWLGSGGFGEVWQAVAPDDSPCALKFIDQGRERLAERESRSLNFMRAVRHPHVLAIRDVFSIERSLVICMELGQGTLKDRLDECQWR